MRKILIITLLLLPFGLQAKSLDLFYSTSTERILFAGESHKDDRARDLFKDSLLSFKSSGGDTLGLEMVESYKQFLLDDYLAYREGSSEALSEYLRVRWQYNTSSYMELISKARDLGLELLAIDLDRRLNPRETELFPVPPDTSKVRIAREAHMAKVLCEFRFKKIIILIGSFHSKKRFLPKGLKSECYAESATFFLSDL